MDPPAPVRPTATLHRLRASACASLALASAVAVVAACGSPAPTDASVDADADAGVGIDTLPVDTGDDDLDVADGAARDADAGSGADVVPDVVADAGGGAVGDPCDQDSDCDDGLCIDVIAGQASGFCTLRCGDDSDCPRDAECVVIGESGADVERVCVPLGLCIDADEDGFGLGPGCDGPDCDDTVPVVHSGADEVCDGLDNDCDSAVDESSVDSNLDCATGFEGVCSAGRSVCVDSLLDCVARTEPSAERCDGLDNDCDGQVDEGDDGSPLARDCYDGPGGSRDVGACVGGAQTCRDAAWSGCVGQVVPVTEVCDGLDNDCDAVADEALPESSFWPDADGDGFGDAAASPISACAAPTGAVSNRSDCDDARSDVRPGGAELPGDGVDQNCDGAEFCFVDGDGDGFRSAAVTVSLDLTCDGPGEAAATAPGGDCNDALATVHPGAEERVADAVDQDCDGLERCFVDADVDGWRPDALATVASPNLVCSDPGEADAAAGVGDCDDADPARHPGVVDVCDGVDNDCDGAVDGGGAGGRWWPDVDGDGYGDSGSESVEACTQPDGYVGVDGDCDDLDQLRNPEAAERAGDEVDQDCDGSEFCLVDGDNDGYRANDAVVLSVDALCGGLGEASLADPAGDCADGNAAIHPDAVELPADGVDQNCDAAELCYLDADGDGWRPTAEATVASANAVCTDLGEASGGAPVGDCDDSLGTRRPGLVDRCDGVDNDCDEVVDNGPDRVTVWPDVDRDGQGSASAASAAACSVAVGWATNNVDCDDSTAARYVGAVEIVANGVDEDCDLRELCFVDLDNDGFRPSESVTQLSLDLACDAPGEAVGSDPAGDCNDAAASVRPGAIELPNDGVDQDCEGTELCFVDADNDGFRPNPTATVVSTNLVCTDAGEALASEPTTDCNDASAAARPGGVEVCDDLDNDCNGRVDEFFANNSCADLRCTGSNRIIHWVDDDCMNDYGSSSGGDWLAVICIDGIERYCLSGETCPWMELQCIPDPWDPWTCYYDWVVTNPPAYAGQTCGMSGLSSRNMANASCDVWRGRNNIYCDAGAVDFL